MPLAAGSQLGRYRILGPLGAGGMGEVYRAHDARLGRDVAVKVLPDRTAAAPEVRARFEREARTISQLNHPHICTVHDVGHEDGRDYLVMELLEGETLAHRLEKGPMPLAEVLSIGRQVCEALDRAHRAGIVHRDLKPGNIMLTRGGAKLMDFGLARSAGGAASFTDSSQVQTVAQPHTAEGTIVGTFLYMAPEQLEGREADARADLWALGCVLYEMTTGQRAFGGDSQASLIAAIMTGQPRPLTELRPVLPATLQKVIQRCLAKRPEERAQSALDVAFMLELVGGEAVPESGAGGSARRPGLPTTVAVAGAVVLGLAAFGIGRLTAPPPPAGSIRVATLSQGNRDSDPAVSPDGRLIAFNAVRQNGPGLWIMDMVTRSEVRLTSEDDRFVRFTPDGGTLVFTRMNQGRVSLWRIPVIGGKPRLLIDEASDADPSPDGAQLAYIKGTFDSAGTRQALVVSRADGTGGRVLWSRGSVNFTQPRWSPDGRAIAITQSGSQNTPSTAIVVEVASGKAREFPAPHGAVLGVGGWDGGGRLILAEGEGVTAVQRGASGQIYSLDVRSGDWRPLGWVEEFPNTFDLLPDGGIVISSLVARQNLCEVPMGARSLQDGHWLTAGLAIDRQPVYSPDGQSILFSSNRGGSLDLWEVSVESGEMHRVTDDPGDDWDPEYSPDGQSIYFCSSRSGAFEIWSARRDGSAPRQLSRDSLDAENPQVAPDQRWVLYSSAHPRKSGLWRIPIEGGDGEWLHKTASLIPDLSPDARYASVITEVGTIETKLSVFDLQEKRPLPRSVPLQVYPGTVQTGRSRFMPDGAHVAHLYTRSDGQPVLLRRPLSHWQTGEGRADTLFAGSRDAIETFDFSPDGKRAIVSVVDWLSGLTIAKSVPGIVPKRRK